MRVQSSSQIFVTAELEFTTTAEIEFRAFERFFKITPYESIPEIQNRQVMRFGDFRHCSFTTQHGRTDDRLRRLSDAHGKRPTTDH